jgi:hypothetical protein
MSALSPERGLVFRITLLANGLHCRSSEAQDPSYVEIGNPDLIERRQHRVVPVPPGGTLSDYVPFYFTPYSPMLYNIKTGWNGITRRPMSEIVIFVSSLTTFAEAGIQFVFTDRHAYLMTATFFTVLADLGRLDWAHWQARDFRHNPNDPDKFARYQAEALAYYHVPIAALHGIVCYGQDQHQELTQMVQKAGASLKVLHKPEWFL